MSYPGNAGSRARLRLGRLPRLWCKPGSRELSPPKFPPPRHRCGTPFRVALGLRRVRHEMPNKPPWRHRHRAAPRRPPYSYNSDANSKYRQNAFAIRICSGVRHSGSNSAGEHSILPLVGPFGLPALARQRRPRGAPRSTRITRNSGPAVARTPAFAADVLTSSQHAASRAHPTRLTHSVRCHFLVAMPPRRKARS
jgi:hypothetical protein